MVTDVWDILRIVILNPRKSLSNVLFKNSRFWAVFSHFTDKSNRQSNYQHSCNRKVIVVVGTSNYKVLERLFSL